MDGTSLGCRDEAASGNVPTVLDLNSLSLTGYPCQCSCSLHPYSVTMKALAHFSALQMTFVSLHKYLGLGFVKLFLCSLSSLKTYFLMCFQGLFLCNMYLL